MTVDEIWQCTDEADLPSNVSIEVRALWFDKMGNWERAHDLIQHLPGKSAAWVHAYLHRKEGDQWNAEYWYRRANQSTATGKSEEEWHEIVENLLNTHYI